MSKYFGDRKFYKNILMIAAPIMIQNGITNFVNMLDNIMVGRLGTEPMSGVAIVNQLFFVYGIIIFGAFSGAGIFTSQYNGIKDHEGVRNTCRFKILVGTLITVVYVSLLVFAGDKLVSLYLNEGSDGNLAETLENALIYIKYNYAGFLPFLLVQIYASTLRECGETVAPMKASIFAVITNFVLNYMLIYGKLFFPALGVKGAAIATVTSRYVEVGYLLVWVYGHKERFPFVKKLTSTLRVPGRVSLNILKTGSPLLLNESLWSIAMAVLTQCYSMRGLDTVSGFSIGNTVYNLFKIVFLSMGTTVGIVVGNLMGAGKMEEAVDTDRKLIVFSMLTSACVAVVMASISKIFPSIYNTSAEAKRIATGLILTESVFISIEAFKNASYFTLRSGGKTWITFFFDGGYAWAVNVPVAFLLSRFTSLSAIKILMIVRMSDFPKAILGYILVKKRIWLKNIVL